MASWQDELARILAKHGIEMEKPGETPSVSMGGASDGSASTNLDFTTFQTSRSSYGVYYRLDLMGTRPVLRVLVPVDEGPHKFRIYLVQLQEDSLIASFFTLQAAMHGSPVLAESENDVLHYRIFLAYSEMMKSLFWKGDLDALQFPAEIHVERLL